MSDQLDQNDSVTRRDALKGIAAGLGASLPVLNSNAAIAQSGAAQEAHKHGTAGAKTETSKPFKAKFFNAEQMALIATISEIIIPTDDSSPGAIAAEVPQFIDLMISESPAEAKKTWTDGLVSMNKLSRDRYQVDFNKATNQQQVALLTEVSRNESKPQTAEEKFFKTIKNMTIDGYYTSKIGIHQELKYKGNTYLKEFKGCTHPEHQG